MGGGWGWMADWTRSLYQQLSILSAALSVLLYQYHREYHTSLLLSHYAWCVNIVQFDDNSGALCSPARRPSSSQTENP
jgi:hypothetical protein